MIVACLLCRFGLSGHSRLSDERYFETGRGTLIRRLAELVRNQPSIDGTRSTRCLPSEQLNKDLRRILDAQTDSRGIKVANVELKQLDLNETMVRAIQVGRGRAPAPRQGDRCGGRVAGAREAAANRPSLGQGARGHAAALPRHASQYRWQEEFNNQFCCADGFRPVSVGLD
jgi:hypothetical protein